MTIIEKLGITPGPWGVDGYYSDNNRRQEYNVVSKNYGCVIGNEGFWRSEKEDCANSRVCAAAPEMLEALIEIIDSCENGGRQYRGKDARSAGKVVIEKATGKTWAEIKELI